MEINIHSLKIESQYFKEIRAGNKTFEIRKNDRNFKFGDELYLNEINNAGEKTGNVIICVVTYVLNDSRFLQAGYVCLGIKYLGFYQREFY